MTKIIIIALVLALTGCTTQQSEPTVAQLHPELYRKVIIHLVTQARQIEGARMDAEARKQTN